MRSCFLKLLPGCLYLSKQALKLVGMVVNVIILCLRCWRFLVLLRKSLGYSLWRGHEFSTLRFVSGFHLLYGSCAHLILRLWVSISLYLLYGSCAYLNFIYLDYIRAE